jgi:hypothetical protein
MLTNFIRNRWAWGRIVWILVSGSVARVLVVQFVRACGLDWGDVNGSFWRLKLICLLPTEFIPPRADSLLCVVRSGADVGICSRRFRRRERSLLGLLDDIQNSASLLSPFKDGGKVALDGCSGTVAVRDSTKYVYFLSNLTFLKTIITISYLVA